MLKDPPGAAVWGMVAEVERTPPVRRPARRDARGLVFAMVIGVDGERCKTIDKGGG